MKVLKFGGTSVANSKNIDQVSAIVASQDNNNVVVVSALGGITDLLMSALQIAAKGESSFTQTLKEIEDFSIQISNLIINLPIWEYSFYHTFLSIKSLKEVVLLTLFMYSLSMFFWSTESLSYLVLNFSSINLNANILISLGSFV